jgi:hypothetical protein
MENTVDKTVSTEEASLLILLTNIKPLRNKH